MRFFKHRLQIWTLSFQNGSEKSIETGVMVSNPSIFSNYMNKLIEIANKKEDINIQYVDMRANSFGKYRIRIKTSNTKMAKYVFAAFVKRYNSAISDIQIKEEKE